MAMRDSRNAQSTCPRTNPFVLLPLALAALLLAPLTSIIRADDQPAGLDESEPLPVHPEFTVGRLENGLRFLIKEHETPREWVAIRLLVETGSLNEEEDQRGLAHFFEHLAFNGSEHFPPGTLIPTFEELGVEFGRNLNASTGFDRTLYLVNLPKNDSETLRTGLLWASDVAFHIGLTPDEIEKEKGVIEEEWRTGLGPQERIMKAMWEGLMPEARLPERWPIGTIEVIRAADRERLKRYYDTWYRPEKMTLMIVGDVETDQVRELVRELFDEPARGDGKKKPDRSANVRPYEEQKSVVVTDPEFVGCDVDLVYMDEAIPPATTIGTMRRQQAHALASWILNRRLDKMIAEREMPFRSAEVAIAPVFGEFTYSTAGAFA